MKNKFIKTKKLNGDNNVKPIGSGEGFCNMSYPLFGGKIRLAKLGKTILETGQKD